MKTDNAVMLKKEFMPFDGDEIYGRYFNVIPI